MSESLKRHSKFLSLIFIVKIWRKRKFWNCRRIFDIYRNWLLTHVKGTKNRRRVAWPAIKKIACVLIAPKLWPSEIAKRYWLKSNYVSIAQATIKADSCRSGGCHNCQRKCHISICDHSRPNSAWFMTAQNKGLEQVIYPVVVNVVKCCVLLDNGAGSSYTSSAVLDHLGIRPIWEEFNVLRWCSRPLARSLESMAWLLAV